MSTLSTKMRKSLAGLGMQLLRVLTFCIALYGILFYFTGLVGSGHFQEKVGNHPLFWGLHVIGGSLSLLASTFVFFPKQGRVNTKRHKTLGYLYVFTVLTSATGGIGLSFYTDSGLMSGLGLGTLAICWIYSTVQSVRYAMLKHHEKHWIWAHRSFALTLSSVFFRLDLGMMMLLVSADYRDIYATVTWHSWIVPLLIMEWIIMEHWPLERRIKPVQPDYFKSTEKA
jgi:hypothetical protein